MWIKEKRFQLAIANSNTGCLIVSEFFHFYQHLLNSYYIHDILKHTDGNREQRSWRFTSSPMIFSLLSSLQLVSPCAQQEARKSYFRLSTMTFCNSIMLECQGLKSNCDYHLLDSSGIKLFARNPKLMSAPNNGLHVFHKALSNTFACWILTPTLKWIILRHLYKEIPGS